MSTIQPFVKGDMIRTEDPDFEMVYQPPSVTPPVPGQATVLDGSGDAIVAGVGPHVNKISVMNSLVDRETGNIGLLQRGYIIQEAGGTLAVDALVKPNATGDPIAADPAVDLGEIYGLVIGKANTNDQTTRLPVVVTDLVIIKVGDA